MPLAIPCLWNDRAGHDFATPNRNVKISYFIISSYFLFVKNWCCYCVVCT